MRFKNVAGAGGYGDHTLLSAKNEDTVPIVKGTPVVLVLNGTDDGFAVVLPSTAGAIKTGSFSFGISVTQLQGGTPVGVQDDFLAYGYCPFALLQNGTRSATTASWNSQASNAAGAALTIDTVNNCFAVYSASGAPGSVYDGYLVDTIASYASSASATSDTRTAITAGYRVFVHML
jgi:hypothetical protein